jgi:excisionase family DNA binding protein
MVQTRNVEAWVGPNDEPQRFSRMNVHLSASRAPNSRGGILLWPATGRYVRAHDNDRWPRDRGSCWRRLAASEMKGMDVRSRSDGDPGSRSARKAAVALSEPLLDCAAAAKLLNVRVSWVRDATRSGQLPCLRVGRHVRFTRGMLEDWLAQVLERGSVDALQPIEGPARRRSGGTAPIAYRRRTEAALLASLAEQPTRRRDG